MKKVSNFLVISFLAAFIFSCTKKDSDSVSPPIQAESIVGKWKDAGTKGHIKMTVEGQTFMEPIDEAATNDIVEFKGDGTILNLSTPGEGSQFTKYTTKNDELILTGRDVNKSFEFIFIYKIVAGKLTLSMDKKLFVKNIEALAKAGVASGFEEIQEYLTFITEIQYEHFMNKQ
jgi:hypothetical protein